MSNFEKFNEFLYKYKEEYCPDNSEKYSQEVEACPTQAYWEKWLTAFCLSLGLNVQTRVQRKSESADGRPDIKIILDNGETLWIECVAPGNATNEQHKVKDPMPDFFGKEQKPFPIPTEASDKAKFRIINALTEKQKQYVARRESGHVKQNEHYIIAVNTADIGIGIWGHFEHNLPPVAQVCYGLKGNEVIVSSPSGMRIEYPKESRIKKNSTAYVDSAFFMRRDHVGISAIIEGHIPDKALLWNPKIKLWDNRNANNFLPNSVIEKFQPPFFE
jgi:hypothetical protein